MADLPEGFDPNIAHIIDAKGHVFQELAPAETVEVVIGEDAKGEPITKEVEMPREWDQTATVEAMSDV